MKSDNNKFGIIVSNTLRSIAYLDILIKNKLIPSELIYLNNKKKINRIKNKYFNHQLDMIAFVKKNNIKFFEINDDNFENENSASYILDSNIKTYVYAGYPSKIIKNKKILSSKNILHSHTGDVSEFKGSTTIFYSLLTKNKISCSTILMNASIDQGNILLIKKYPLPTNLLNINDVYDYFIRALNMIIVVKNFKKIYKNKKKCATNKPLYTVMHPALRYITLNNNYFK